MHQKQKPRIGFIGQGFIGKSYADDFVERGFSVVRYSHEEQYVANREMITMCDIVFIAVPTPTTPVGFDDHIVRDVLSLVGKGKIAVIKSTILPGTTRNIQAQFPDITVFHSPEFLTAKNASYEAKHPERNIVGIVTDTAEIRAKAQFVVDMLPKAPYANICSVEEAELIKYGGNCWFYFKVVYINMLYDLAHQYGADWEVIEKGLSADPRIGSTHLNPVHQGGRGAGGYCFIKDFAAFRGLYEKTFSDDVNGVELLRSMEKKNRELLMSTGKDSVLLAGVYGK
jgi:UDPglucose 6-dehydrogenase